MGECEWMAETIALSASGQIILPDSVNRLFGAEPGVRMRAEVTADRIELVKEVPEVSETMRSSSGRLVLAPTGIKVDAGKAGREERDALADRALTK